MITLIDEQIPSLPSAHAPQVDEVCLGYHKGQIDRCMDR